MITNRSLQGELYQKVMRSLKHKQELIDIFDNLKQKFAHVPELEKKWIYENIEHR
jgi:hypothetical protein